MARKTIDELLGGEKRFGLLTVVGEGQQHKAAGSVGRTTRTIRFRCDCGSVVDLRPGSIRHGKRSCGCVRPKPILRAIEPPKVKLGARFNRWTVVGDIVSRARKHGGFRLTALCRCDCGTESYVWIDTLRRNTSKSCGCYRVEASRKRQTSHGQSRIGKVGRGTPEYAAWMNMIRRCKNPDHPDFLNYGGRGIEVCKEWQESFSVFLRDVGERPSGKHSIDRTEVNGNYEPRNCRWATREEQSRNKRGTRLVGFRGQSMPLIEAAEIANLSYHSLANRIFSLGWSVERAFSTPASSFKPLKRLALTANNGSKMKRGAEGHHSDSDIRRIYKLQRGRCAYCKHPLKNHPHRDHIRPVSKGGTHFARNIQLLCQPCNARKGSKPPEEFARQIGLLI